MRTVTTKQEIRDYFAKFGKQGGRATARNRTPEQRSEAARKAVLARWAKDKKQIEKSLREMNKSLDLAESKRLTKKKGSSK